jgi:thiamine-monophosphate kinase
MKDELFFVSLLRQRSDAEAVAHASTSASGFRLHLSSLRLGIGDDAAIIARSNAGETVITTDLLVENIDFRRSWMPPRLLGHKALAVSLSDVAAMGAQPRFALVSLGVPEEVWRTDFVEQFYEGWFALAARYGVALVGGDTSRTPGHIVVDSIVIGETAPERAAIRRSTARPGDLIYVTGALGGAAAGLELLENGARYDESDADTPAQQLIRRQLAPTPRVEFGLKLNEPPLATAMLDLSDGLSTDLARLCAASGVGAVVEADKIPLQSTLSHALNGGEDFELLFTCAPEHEVAATQIGEITSEQGFWLRAADGTRTTLESGGFIHF